MIEKIPMTQICATKLRMLESQNMEIVGIVLVDRDAKNGVYKRATVDNFGRVQWWMVDESGRMAEMRA